MYRQHGHAATANDRRGAPTAELLQIMPCTGIRIANRLSWLRNSLSTTHVPVHAMIMSSAYAAYYHIIAPELGSRHVYTFGIPEQKPISR